MVSLTSLWLPILVSAVGVFVLSSILWMALPYHKGDYKKLPDDDTFLDAVRAQRLAAGQYMFPGCTPQDVKTPEGKARFERGPWGVLLVRGDAPSMGRSLSRWFLFTLLVSLLVAYVMGHALPAGTGSHRVFQLAGTMAWSVYGLVSLPAFIWEGKPGSYVVKSVTDGLIYGLATGAIFGWLWPDMA